MRILSLFVPLVLALAAPAAANATTIEDLAWMKGCWRTEDGATIEMWSAPPVGAMLGFSYTWRDNRLQSWEDTRIDSVGGMLGYVAMPGGGAPVRFPMVEGDDRHVVFANPSHDFPQRIEYARGARNHIIATVSGGSGAPEVYRYEHMDCPDNVLPEPGGRHIF